MKKKTKFNADELYKLVEKLRKEPKDTSRNKGYFNFSNTLTMKALRIHRHLRALERDILDQSQSNTMEDPVSLELDPGSKRIIISIHNDEIHCRRVAYLSNREFSFLRKNPKIENILKKCPAWKDVA